MPIHNFKPRNIIAPKIESMQDTYESGASRPPLPPTPPPAPCLLDIVIGCDISGSMATSLQNNWAGVNDFVRELVTGLDAQMNGSIAGIPGPSNIQVGTYVWDHLGWGPGSAAQDVRNMTDDSSLIESDTNSPLLDQILGVHVGGGDDYDVAVDMGMTMLNGFGVLGNRSSQPNYRRIMIIVTDAISLNACGNVPGTPIGLQTNMSTDVWNVGSLAGSPELDVEVYTVTVHTGSQPPSAYPGNVECLVPLSAQSTNIDHGSGTTLGALGTALANTICGSVFTPTYDCTGPITVNTPSASYPPWTCYNPGTGMGQYSGPTALADCLTACDPNYVSDCLLDIVIAVDLSGSTGLPPTIPGSWHGWGIYEAERKLLEGLIDYLTPGMVAGEIQVGVVFWASGSTSLNPDGFSMSSSHLGDLNTSKILQDPNGDWHSPIAKHMYDAVVAQGNMVGTDIGSAMQKVFTLSGILTPGGQPTPGVLNRKTTSDFATQYPVRANDPDFTQVGVIITDSIAGPVLSGLSVTSATSQGCIYQSDSLTPNPFAISGPTKQFVIGCVARPGEFINIAPPSAQQDIKDTLDAITCMQNGGSNPWNTSATSGNYGFYVNTSDPQNINYVGGAIMSQACFPNVVETYDCNDPTTATYNPLLPNYWCYNPGTGTGQFTGSTAYQDCVDNCEDPWGTISWECSGALGITLPSGQFIAQWTCYDPGTGLGQFPTQNDCQTALWTNPGHPLYGLPVCQPPPESYNCFIPWQATVGTCSDPLDGTGQYSVANGYLNPQQDCIDNCQVHQVIEWPVLTGDPCEICCCEPYQTGPGAPWICAPGTQVMSISTLSPCNCATMGMIDCAEDVGPPVYGYNCLPNTGQCIGPVANGAYTAANAALQINQATGQPYPNSLAGALAYCEDSCFPVLGTFCTPLLSCPCGWTYSPTASGVNCTDPALPNNPMPAIEKCFMFPPNIPPLVGDVWVHTGSYLGLTWNEAYVIPGFGTPIQANPTYETPTQCF